MCAVFEPLVEGKPEVWVARRVAQVLEPSIKLLNLVSQFCLQLESRFSLRFTMEDLVAAVPTVKSKFLERPDQMGCPAAFFICTGRGESHCLCISLL